MRARKLRVQLCKVQCGRQTVRVVHPTGQICKLWEPIRVSDLLRRNPHHYICNAADHNGTILPLDAQLEQGNIYLLLPFPRLFPCSAAPSPSCCCYGAQGRHIFLQESSRRSPLTGFLRVPPRKTAISRGLNAARVLPEEKSVARYNMNAAFSPKAKKFSAERSGEAQYWKKEMELFEFDDAVRGLRSWKPKLECIWEDKLFVWVDEVDRIADEKLKAAAVRRRRKPVVQGVAEMKSSERESKIDWRRVVAGGGSGGSAMSPFRPSSPLPFMF